MDGSIYGQDGGLPPGCTQDMLDHHLEGEDRPFGKRAPLVHSPTGREKCNQCGRKVGECRCGGEDEPGF